MTGNSKEKVDPLDPVVVNETAPFVKDKHLYPPEYEGHFDSVMITAHDIQERVKVLAEAIHKDYQGTRVVLICTLKGACPFYVHLADALQNVRQGYDLEFVRASSYCGTVSTGNVQVSGELNVDSLKNRHVLVIEDILDTGATLASLIPNLKEAGKPSSIEVCTLLDKRLEGDATKSFQAKYVGFSIPDKFIIGYGLDYNELYRDLKDIFVISKAGIEFDVSKLPL